MKTRLWILVALGWLGCSGDGGGLPLPGSADARTDGGTTRPSPDSRIGHADARPFSCDSDIQNEPNDSRALATFLPMQPEVVLTNMAICPVTDQDYYAFVVSQTENVRIALTYDAGSGDLDFDLWDEKGTGYTINSVRTGDTTVFTGDWLHWGTWYVRVFATEPATNNYDLDVRLGL